MQKLLRTSSEIDPVCGMKVDPVKSPHRFDYAGRSHHFCSASCHSKFSLDPEKYLARTDREQTAAPAGTIYTCPMHLQIRQAGPGTCPICGMALEPEDGSAGDNAELADMTRRFWISLVLAVPVFVIEMGGHIGLFHLANGIATPAQFILATPVVLWGGWPFFVRGAQSLRSGHLYGRNGSRGPGYRCRFQSADGSQERSRAAQSGSRAVNTEAIS